LIISSTRTASFGGSRPSLMRRRAKLYDAVSTSTENVDQGSSLTRWIGFTSKCSNRSSPSASKYGGETPDTGALASWPLATKPCESMTPAASRFTSSARCSARRSPVTTISLSVAWRYDGAGSVAAFAGYAGAALTGPASAVIGTSTGGGSMSTGSCMSPRRESRRRSTVVSISAGGIAGSDRSRNMGHITAIANAAMQPLAAALTAVRLTSPHFMPVLP
jgi:hypothetical protein